MKNGAPRGDAMAESWRKETTNWHNYTPKRKSMKSKRDNLPEVETVLSGIGVEEKEQFQITVFNAFKNATSGNTQHFIAVVPIVWMDFINALLEYGASNYWVYRSDLTTSAYRLMTMTFEKRKEE